MKGTAPMEAPSNRLLSSVRLRKVDTSFLDAKKDRFNERKIIDKTCSSNYYMATIVTVITRKACEYPLDNLFEVIFINGRDNGLREMNKESSH